MNRYCFVFLSLLFSTEIIAQRGTVKGNLFDTLANQPVANATISLLQKKDSALVSFTMSDDKGRFEISNIKDGEYSLMITHVNYHNSYRSLTINETVKETELGRIVMNDLSKVLEEVIVKNDAPPVTLVGDTIQYNAGSFKVQPNANVEDLLKKMPGIKVDKDGTVKAQGEKVSKVLVDGKEFFGNDPKIATKNLPADAIDKVQVFNKLSDQAQLTGFDDGNSEKTINLKLKKDKTKGYFGKINAGGGTDDRYQGKFNINSFKGARQMSAIGMANNTNSEAFSMFDILNFTGELKKMISGGGGNININISNSASSGMDGIAGSNSGINTIWGGGVNYNNIIGTKTDFMSNYFYNRYNPHKESTVQRHYFLPDSSYLYNQNQVSDNINNSHRLNFVADFQIDSFNSIKISPSLNYQKTSNRVNSTYSTMSEAMEKGSDGYSNNLTNNEGYNFRTDVLFRKKFRRKGRTFSIALQTTFNNNDGDASLQSLNNFYIKTGTIYQSDTINQQTKTESSLNGYTARVVYTEPVFKRSLLEFSAGNGNTTSTSAKTTHDYNSQNGKFDLINPLLSNDFKNQYGYSNAGIRLRKQAKKYNFAVGFSWQHSELEGKIISNNKDSVIGKSFNNILPTARLQYYFTRFKNLQVNYSTFTNQPTVTQLQPVIDNSDPLNKTTGNPALKQEYTHSLQTNLILVNPYTNRNLFVLFNLQETQNKIVNNDTIDGQGIKTSRPVNANGIYNLSGDVNWSIPVHFLKASFSIGSNASYYKGKQFVNGAENKIAALSFGPDVRLDIGASEKLQLALTTGLSYNRTTYSLQSSYNTSYISHQYGFDADWQLPAKFFLASEFTYSINNQLAAGFNSRIPLWNASLSRQVLRFNRGEIKLRVNDILNKNIAVSRTSNQNYIEDSRVLNLRRFFLLSFTYSLTKTGLTKEGAGGGMRMIRR
ncbi:MAG: outer membrane beta-barrel protein [Chitinophagaceae bacterium]